MKSHSSRSRVLKALAFAVIAVAFGWVTPASAQHPTANTWTAEGTQIKNKATASFTDARNNTYTDVESNEVTVTVGFRGSIAVLAVATPLTFTQDGTGSAQFTVTNYGNGADSVKYAFTNTNGATFTNAQFCVPDGADADTDPDCYASIAALRAAELLIAAGGSLTITVTFDVAEGSGGEAGTFTLAGSSARDAANTADSDDIELSVDLIDMTPGNPGNVAVTAGGPASVVPTNYNSTTRLYYDATFTVANNLAGGATFDLGSVIAGDADITIIRLALCSDKATAVTSVAIAYAGSASICVLYNVADAATAADAAAVTLTATAQADNSITDNDDYAITVIKAAITLTKKAFLDDGTTEITTEKPLPGDFIIYEITVKNEGGASASSVSITDVLPSEVTYVSSTADAAGWVIDDTEAPTITGTLATLGATNERFFRIRVQIN